MAADFQEYRGKRKPINPQHKFPLLRLLIVALAAFLVYWSGLPSKIANALPLSINDPVPVVETWDSRCISFHGIPESVSDSLAQCSWTLNDSLLLPTPFLRYLYSLRSSTNAKIVWTFPKSSFASPVLVCFENGVNDCYYHMMKKDSSYAWIREARPNTKKLTEEETRVQRERLNDNGCSFPGVCPHVPLEWSALPITEGFDFEGQESLIAMDVFRGVGEAPIYAVLPGHILNVGKDSLGYFVEIDHGGNISSVTSGMGLPGDSLKVGDSVRVDVPIGRLAPRDSSVFYLSLRENGRFVRWKDFYANAYPFTAKEIVAFKQSFR